MLFEAQALPASHRLSWLTQQCDGDPDLLRKMQELVDFSGLQNDILDGALPEALGWKSTQLEPLLPGTVLGARYRIVSLLAHGGFATVYLAKDERLANRDVVVKVLDQVHLASALQNASKEIQALATISNPGVVGILDCGTN